MKYYEKPVMKDMLVTGEMGCFCLIIGMGW